MTMNTEEDPLQVAMRDVQEGSYEANREQVTASQLEGHLASLQRQREDLRARLDKAGWNPTARQGLEEGLARCDGEIAARQEALEQAKAAQTAALQRVNRGRERLDYEQQMRGAR